MLFKKLWNRVFLLIDQKWKRNLVKWFLTIVKFLNQHPINSVQNPVKSCKVVVKDCQASSHNSELDQLIRKCGDGSQSRIFKCRSKRKCEMKKDFVPRDSCLSSGTFRTYPCVIPPGTVYLDCHSQNVVYLITCLNCGMQYVGGEYTFRQVIGIPMGSDPAPFMTNLFLYHYECKYVKETKKTDLFKARRFRHTFRLIDDLLAINDGWEFDKNLIFW